MRDQSDKLILAQSQLQMGRAEDARNTLLRALQRGGTGPVGAAMSHLLSQILLQNGQKEQALYYAERARSHPGASPDARVQYANVLWALGRAADAIAAARDAVQAAPASRNAHGTLVNFLLREERFADALEACGAALDRFPIDPEFVAIRATMLLSVGRPEEAVAGLRGALGRDPGNLRLLGALGPALNYAPGIEPSERLDIHRRFGQALVAALPPLPPRAQTPREPERTLRIGLMSPDLRSHAMWHFVHPMLEHLDRAQFDIFCYFTGAHADAGTETLKSHVAADRWRHVPTLNIAQLADAIRADAIDILIDLAGHTRYNRLGTMALGPAPLQMNFTGYPCTTGVPRTDYHVTDSLCSPPGGPQLFLERLLRVDPLFFCYRPPPALPEVAPPSSDVAGHVTFGSFNTLMKLNDRVVAAWARVINSVPGSRLVVKNIQLMQEQARALTRERFAAAGVPPERLEILGHQGTMADHLTTYSRVDIALDTFPYAGMTTTCESLMMGVPVVTLAHQAFASRVGLAILTNVGLANLAAGDEDAFVAAAVALARDPDRRRSLRSSLRRTLLASPVCDGPLYGRNFGAALRQAWRDHCAGH